MAKKVKVNNGGNLVSKAWKRIAGIALAAGVAIGTTAVVVSCHNNSEEPPLTSDSITEEIIDSTLPEDTTEDSTNNESSDENSSESNVGVSGDVVDVNEVYANLMGKIDQKTKFVADEIESIKLENNQLRIVVVATNNDNQKVRRFVTITLTEEQVSVVEAAIDAAYANKDNASYVEYLTSIYDIVAGAKDFKTGGCIPGNTTTLNIPSDQIAAIMSSYYKANNDRENAIKIDNYYENADASSISNAVLSYTVKEKTCTVTATIGEIEMSLTFNVKPNATLQDLKVYITKCLDSKNPNLAEIVEVAYSNNKQDKVIVEINELIEEDKTVEEEVVEDSSAEEEIVEDADLTSDDLV